MYYVTCDGEILEDVEDLAAAVTLAQAVGGEVYRPATEAEIVAALEAAGLPQELLEEELAGGAGEREVGRRVWPPLVSQ